jgi:hypothetical protein
MTLIYIRRTLLLTNALLTHTYKHTYSCKAYGQATECIGSQSIVHLRHKGLQDFVRLR